MIKVRIHLKRQHDIAIIPASYNQNLVQEAQRLLPTLNLQPYSVSGLWLMQPFKYKGSSLYLENNVNFELSLYTNELWIDDLKDAFLHKEISLGGESTGFNQFTVSGVQALVSPVFQEVMRYSSISPICIRHKFEEMNHQTYLNPIDNHEIFKDLIIQKLYDKYIQLGGERFSPSISMTVLSEPRQKLYKITTPTHQTISIKGYMMDFEIKMNKQLQMLAYFGGLGDMRQFGFGALKHLL